MTILYVNHSSQSGLNQYSSIQDAVDHAKHQDIIEVAAGDYYENVKIDKPRVPWTSPGKIKRSLRFFIKLKGVGTPNPHVYNFVTGIHQAGGPILSVGRDTFLSLENITIKGSPYSEYGGGIYNEGILWLNSVAIKDNRAKFGGGIYNRGSLTIESSIISFNSSSIEKGAGIYNLKDITLNSGVIAYNKGGAGIYNWENLVMNGGKLYQNQRGIYNCWGKIDLNGGDIYDNSVDASKGELGGGIYNEVGEINLNGCHLFKNKAYMGGGIFNIGENTTSGFIQGIINMNKGELKENSAIMGGGIFNKRARVNIYGGSISSNSANIGAGIFNYNGWIILNGGSIESNEANVYGGGIAIGRDSWYKEVEDGNKIGNPQLIIESGKITSNHAIEEKSGGIATPELGPGLISYFNWAKGKHFSDFVYGNHPWDYSPAEKEEFLDDYDSVQP